MIIININLLRNEKFTTYPAPINLYKRKVISYNEIKIRTMMFNSATRRVSNGLLLKTAHLGKCMSSNLKKEPGVIEAKRQVVMIVGKNKDAIDSPLHNKTALAFPGKDEYSGSTLLAPHSRSEYPGPSEKISNQTFDGQNHAQHITRAVSFVKEDIKNFRLLSLRNIGIPFTTTAQMDGTRRELRLVEEKILKIPGAVALHESVINNSADLGLIKNISETIK